MKKKLPTILLGLVSLGLLAPAQPQPKTLPFLVRSAAEKLSSSEHKGVLIESPEFRIYRKLQANDSEFEDLYWVNLNNLHKYRFELERFGKLLHLENGAFAIMKIKNEEHVLELSRVLHAEGMACGSVIRLYGDTIAEPNIAKSQPVVDTKIAHQLIKSSLNDVNPENIQAHVEFLSSLPTRYFDSETGKTVASQLAERYRELAQGRDDVLIETYQHKTLPQDSLRVRIIGQRAPEDIVVLGSHIDSINGWGGANASAPGADDNASGTATNLEIFRVMMAKGLRFERTVEIHGYSAEEVGLRGSQDIASSYKAEDKKVIAMVQHDMNLYSANRQDKIWLVSNDTNAELNSQLINLIEQYLTIPYGTKPLYAGTSDHYSWTRQGFAAAFPFENPAEYNPNIHTENDLISESGRFSQAAEFARLGVAYLGHFAGVID